MKEIFPVMGLDALASSHPLSCEEEAIVTPDDIRYMFDTITYSKVSRRLRSLHTKNPADVFE